LQFMHILIEGVEGLAERAWPAGGSGSGRR
jgi:hypothetical protein